MNFMMKVHSVDSKATVNRSWCIQVTFKSIRDWCYKQKTTDTLDHTKMVQNDFMRWAHFAIFEC